MSNTKRSSRPRRRGRGLKPSAGTAGALRASRPATRGVDAAPMPARASEHGDGARAERPGTRPHSRGLLSAGQGLSGTNAAPTQHKKGEIGNTVRGGAFAQTSTEKGQGPFAHRPASERPDASAQSPSPSGSDYWRSNAAPTQHEKREFGNSVRRGAFAHTNTEKGQWPFAHRPASEQPPAERRSPADR